LEVPFDAWGTFTISFINDENQTFLMDGESLNFPPSSTIPALITVTNDCNGNGVPDGSIDIIDAAMGVDAFRNFNYPYDSPCL
jgi:hypothetical protein